MSNSTEMVEKYLENGDFGKGGVASRVTADYRLFWDHNVFEIDGRNLSIICT